MRDYTGLAITANLFELFPGGSHVKSVSWRLSASPLIIEKSFGSTILLFDILYLKVWLSISTIISSPICKSINTKTNKNRILYYSFEILIR